MKALELQKFGKKLKLRKSGGGVRIKKDNHSQNT